MKWDLLTSPQIDALDRSIPVVMNIGAVEQHGPHLPVATDHMIGGYFLDQIDEQIPDGILIIPSVKVCCSAHHMDFSGTLTVSHETLIHYVSDICSAVHAQGFKTFVLFNSHGGNLAVGHVLVEKLGAQFLDMSIAMLTWWQIAPDALNAIQESGFGGVGHACEFETSILMAIDPNLVQPTYKNDYSQPETFHWAAADMLTGSKASLHRSMNEITGGTGVAGCPKLATVEKGQAITQAVTMAAIEILDDLKNVSGKRQK